MLLKKYRIRNCIWKRGDSDMCGTCIFYNDKNTIFIEGKRSKCRSIEESLLKRFAGK